MGESALNQSVRWRGSLLEAYLGGERALARLPMHGSRSLTTPLSPGLACPSSAGNAGAARVGGGTEDSDAQAYRRLLLGEPGCRG